MFLGASSITLIVLYFHQVFIPYAGTGKKSSPNEGIKQSMMYIPVCIHEAMFATSGQKMGRKKEH